MMKYGGTVVYRTDGVEGPLEVVDEHLIRSLHFGDATRQSSMLRSNPAVLVLAYTQFILVPLLFRPNPRRILLLGLGGGSLPRFFASHFPDALLDVVELRADVIDAARRFFGMPEEPAVTIHHQDCARFVADAGRDHADYDLVFLDIYDETGMVPLVAERPFLERLGARLAPDGILAGNLSRVQRPVLRNSLRSIRSCYGGEVFRLPVLDKGNEIVLATMAGRLETGAPGVRKRATAMKERFGLDFPGFLDGLQRYDASLLEKLTGRRRSRRRQRG